MIRWRWETLPACSRLATCEFRAHYLTSNWPKRRPCEGLGVNAETVTAQVALDIGKVSKRLTAGSRAG